MINLLKICSLTLFSVSMLAAPVFAVESQVITQRNRSLTYAQAGISELKVSDTKTEANSGRGGFHYFLTKRFSLGAGYYSMTSITSGKTLMSGFDGGMRLYIFSPGIEDDISSPSLIIKSWTNISHFAEIYYAQRTLSVNEQQIGYSGIVYGYGLSVSLRMITDLPVIRDVSINASAQSENLSAFGANSISVTNLLLGAELTL